MYEQIESIREIVNHLREIKVSWTENTQQTADKLTKIADEMERLHRTAGRRLMYKQYHDELEVELERYFQEKDN